MNLINYIEQKYVTNAKKLPQFKSGDRVRVHVKIQEGEKERIQQFDGIVIRIRNAQGRSSFTVRKISYGVGVERVFPFYSPSIDRIEVVNSSKVRRAKLYYLRKLSGRKARMTVIEGDAQGPEVAGEVEAPKPAA